ncbi:hypothetical protein GX48_07807 [Paracoccidioides brasiliensis]|nr:hypothetical protein GX48_07807 [Paracoccidioides brasiliensis]
MGPDGTLSFTSSVGMVSTPAHYWLRHLDLCGSEAKGSKGSLNGEDGSSGCVSRDQQRKESGFQRWETDISDRRIETFSNDNPKQPVRVRSLTSLRIKNHHFSSQIILSFFPTFRLVIYYLPILVADTKRGGGRIRTLRRGNKTREKSKT